MSDSTQGNGAPGAPQGTDGSPNAISMDEVNRAITARLKSFESKFEKTVGESFGKFESLITERLGAKAEEPATSGKASDENPAVKGLQRQLAEMQKRLESSEQEKQAERAKLKDRDLRSKVAETLAKHGIDGHRAKHAIGFLVDAQKSIKWADDETLAFGDVDFDTGVSEWLKTEDAKLYLPPRGTSGSGDRAATGRGNAPPDPNAQARDVLAQFLTGRQG